MSSPDLVLELSDSAQSDFRDILSYTRQMWGDRQVDTYREVIDSALKAVGANPTAGR